mmetsp:Transcript_11468/g.17295  ORF Transcript_11468/g.17295 Transcript_11468/m.17295 type:complete len:394 (-) Transcript_11468:1166-2347(-)|eukprot:CAMPEP_0196815128 /NCGR_PEP_ID=MMETSP1362-20130617/47909_1 /TAXON_ID=163516 /ORGANISM="Leptocylindrus danicus, Strain CCMP1856" /LENGTH=393 /DNA_ID=CAMNT_0042191983 /DNA_START=227 /DNA_END=1408 /DNA_ORIENTATION=-
MTEQNTNNNNKNQQHDSPQFDVKGDVHAFIGQLQALADKTELEIKEVVEDYKREALLQVIESRKKQKSAQQEQQVQKSVDHPVTINIDFDLSNDDDNNENKNAMMVADEQPAQLQLKQQGKNKKQEEMMSAAIVHAPPPQATAAIQPMRIMQMPAPIMQNNKPPPPPPLQVHPPTTTHLQARPHPRPHPPVHHQQQTRAPQNNVNKMGVPILQQQEQMPLSNRQLPPVTALTSPPPIVHQPRPPINTNNAVYVQKQHQQGAEDPFEGAISWFNKDHEMTAPKRSIFLLMIHVSTCPPEQGQPRPDGTVCTSKSCVGLKNYLKELAIHKQNGCGSAAGSMSTCRRCIKTSMVLTAHSRICAEKACKVLGCQALKASARSPAAAPKREVVNIDDD